MSKTKTILIAGALCLAFTGISFAEDNYDKLAKELSEAGSDFSNKKIAIIPFSYTDGKESKDGSVISERLTMRMIKLKKFEIIERSTLDKVMNELKLQASGIMDASSTKELGKLLGVEAIVTGTLLTTQEGKIEVNARLIKTETAQAIGASSVVVPKDWMGGDAQPVSQQPYQQTYQQPVQQPIQQPYQQPYVQPVAQPLVRDKHQYGFFDIFLGFGAPNMALEFKNSNANITINDTYTNDIGICVGANCDSTISSSNDYRSVRFDKLSTEGFGPIAFRVGGFGRGNIGADVEFSFEKRNIKQQTAPWKLNGTSAGNVTFNSNDYATVKSFGISGDLLIRVPGEKIDPYLGIGLGLSLNAIDLPYVKGLTDSSTFSRPVSDFGAGLMFRIPIGMRIRIAEKTQMVAELRYELNSIFFDRNITGESDNIVISGAKFLIGFGFNF